MYRATATSLAPDMMGTVISTGSSPPGVTRKCNRPVDAACPLGAIFHAFETGKLLAAFANRAMAATIETMNMARIFIPWLRQARPGGFRGAPAFEKAIRLPL